MNRSGLVQPERESPPRKNVPGTAPGGAVKPRSVRPDATPDASQRARRKKRREKRKRRVLFVPFFSLAAAAVALWWYAHRAPAAVVSTPSSAKVTARDFSSSVLATGAVQAQIGAEVRVGARISGKVERLLANIGDQVVKGQVIAQLEKADLEAKVAQREAELRR